MTYPKPEHFERGTIVKHYLEHFSKIMADLSVTENGLSHSEAAERQAKYGPNKLMEAEKESLISKFISQLIDPMILVLLAAAVISAITASMSGEGFADVFIILFVVVMNAVLGVYQENKAEAAIEALQKIAAATSKVIRDGHRITIKSEELVPGDIIVLETGDSVPADARVIESASMKIEEAALTGESVPVTKSADVLKAEENGEVPLGDRKNMVYMGSTVAYGRGKAVVVATGMETEMGKIAGALSRAKDEDTPLQRKMGELSKILSVLVLVICAVIFAVDMLRNLSAGITGAMMLDTFMVAVSLAVAAIPEGLSAVVTILLSIGVTKMSNNRAIIRRLTAVETLGCTQIICSDKTGTLTQNKMTVVRRHTDNEELHLKAMALCSDAELEDGQAVGEPTECALVNDANKENLSKDELKKEYPRVDEAPFDSGRKMMSTVHAKAGGGFIQFTKGAPDEVLKRCTKAYVNGKAVDMTEKIMSSILSANKSMADKALRVLCSAYKLYDEKPVSNEAEYLERDMIYLGLSGMIDPIRPEVKDAIDECKAAGIRAVMITGDHKDTAVAIANQLGILNEGQEALTGAQIGEMSDEELIKNIEKYSVYARVQPEHKVRIVSAWKAKNKITAMTGDGVNDAPSIKTADIGIGMGITGTDVTKNVADMVLADDNFATIVKAVAEGRRIYDNIRKAIQYLLSANMAEVLSVFFATLLNFTILKPAHLLWINLVTDSLPAIALGMEETEQDIMQKPPRDSSDGIFAGGMAFDILYQGVAIAALTVLSFIAGHRMETGVWEFTNSADGITMAFLTLSLTEMLHSINMRSRRGSIFKMGHKNKYLAYSLIGTAAITLAAIYVPFLSNAFGFTHISLIECAAAIAISLLIVPITEIGKAVQRKMGR